MKYNITSYYKIALFFVIALFVLPISTAKNLPLYTNPNEVIVVKPDQPEFLIQLKSNRTTGYSWFLTFYDANYIKVISHRYVPSSTTFVGAGGIEEWKLKLIDRAFIAPTKLTLQFIYARPWEAKKVGKTVVFRVVSAHLP